MNRTNTPLIAVAVVAILLCLAFIVWGLGNLPEVSMGIHGWIALGLGTVVSVAVGGGLAAILIISRRNGYDEAAHQVFKDSEPDL
ncbi:hypothetical protein [Maricaulis sp.]|uniref:hypothetical protein n=1 Tax=Maricaulis sp. TaxID=1486257 RepID=UPI001B2C7681|nr:hypothetical protein [Maricaulis sp.]MBO6763909.1 hypothetical protein [Maricaulis sp.]